MHFKEKTYGYVRIHNGGRIDVIRNIIEKMKDVVDRVPLEFRDTIYMSCNGSGDNTVTITIIAKAHMDDDDIRKMTKLALAEREKKTIEYYRLKRELGL